MLAAVRDMSDDITVAVVANIKPSGKLAGDYGVTSVTTEYLSRGEASQILGGLQGNGFYTKFFDGELAFITASVNGQFDDLPRPRKLVYNIAQSGTGIGRKALVPAFCRLKGIPICNSDSYAVSLARHKFHVYCVLRQLGIPVVESWLFDASGGWLRDLRPPAGTRLIAKACFESASIGLEQDSIGELSPEYEGTLRSKSLALRQPIIVQRFISGFEVEVPVLAVNGRASSLAPVSITLDGDLLLEGKFLDFGRVEFDDYGFASAEHLGGPTLDGLREAAAATFRALGIGVLGRIDFRVETNGGAIYVTDVATSPHLIEHSSIAFEFAAQGLSHADLMGVIVAANAQRLGWLS